LLYLLHLAKKEKEGKREKYVPEMKNCECNCTVHPPLSWEMIQYLVCSSSLSRWDLWECE